MKKFLLIMTASFITLAFAGCSDEGGNSSRKDSSSFVHTTTSQTTTSQTTETEPTTTSQTVETEPEMTQNTSDPAVPQGDDDVYLSVKVVAADEDSTDFDYIFVNNCPVPVELNDVKVTLNGADISDEVYIWLAADAGENVTDSFTIYSKINIGDEIVISGTLVNTDTYDTLGNVEFPLILQ